MPSRSIHVSQMARFHSFLWLNNIPFYIYLFYILFIHSSTNGHLKVKVLVAQSCPTLCDHMDCRLPGSSVHEILYVRTLEEVAFPFLQGIFLTQGSNPGLPHCRQILYHLSHQGTTRELAASGQPSGYLGFFNLLGIINNASVNIEVPISFQVSIFIFSG